MGIDRILWDSNEKHFFRSTDKSAKEIVQPEPIGEPVWISESMDREMGPNYYAEMMKKSYVSHAPEGANAYSKSRLSSGYPVRAVQYYKLNGNKSC